MISLGIINLIKILLLEITTFILLSKVEQRLGNDPQPNCDYLALAELLQVIDRVYAGQHIRFTGRWRWGDGIGGTTAQYFLKSLLSYYRAEEWTGADTHWISTCMCMLPMSSLRLCMCWGRMVTGLCRQPAIWMPVGQPSDGTCL